MSIRIETLEQLQDPVILEKVLDRLRRTTRPRPFAFKKRCKVLGNVPLLLTAPPGRKIKSSLLRSLRLGTPTQKGIVHREDQRLIFTFTKPVNATETARWIAKCMHNAKSPVPLKCIEIRQPDESTRDPAALSEPSKKTDESGLEPETALLHEHDACDSLPPVDPSIEASESLDMPSLWTSDDIEALLIKHTSSKKIKWLQDTNNTIEAIEADINQRIQTIEVIEEELYELEISIEDLEQQLQSDIQSTESNPWTCLFETCQATSWSLDEIRACLDEAKVNTLPLLTDLQFLSDDDEMIAYKLVREYCSNQSKEWIRNSQSTEWKEAYHRNSERHLDLCSELDGQHKSLTELETQQETLQTKYNKRKLEVLKKLQEHLHQSSISTDSIQSQLTEIIEKLQSST